jgi:hypothetical protein
MDEIVHHEECEPPLPKDNNGNTSRNYGEIRRRATKRDHQEIDISGREVNLLKKQFYSAFEEINRLMNEDKVKNLDCFEELQSEFSNLKKSKVEVEQKLQEIIRSKSNTLTKVFSTYNSGYRRERYESIENYMKETINFRLKIDKLLKNDKYSENEQHKIYQDIGKCILQKYFWLGYQKSKNEEVDYPIIEKYEELGQFDQKFLFLNLKHGRQANIQRIKDTLSKRAIKVFDKIEQAIVYMLLKGINLELVEEKHKELSNTYKHQYKHVWEHIHTLHQQKNKIRKDIESLEYTLDHINKQELDEDLKRFIPLISKLIESAHNYKSLLDDRIIKEYEHIDDITLQLGTRNSGSAFFHQEEMIPYQLKEGQKALRALTIAEGETIVDCGPLSIATIASDYNPLYRDPDKETLREIGRLFNKYGANASWSLFRDKYSTDLTDVNQNVRALNKMGLSYTLRGFESEDDLRKEIKNGMPIPLGIVDERTGGAHQIVIDGLREVNSIEYVDIRDPENYLAENSYSVPFTSVWLKTMKADCDYQIVYDMMKPNNQRSDELTQLPQE